MKSYLYTCGNCGLESTIKSNQPAGGQEPFVCSCYQGLTLILPDNVSGKHRYTAREETFALQSAIIEVITEIQEPMTVRQIFYRLVAGGYPKEESFYSKVQRNLLDMRERGLLPYDLIADNSRSFYQPTAYSSLAKMLEEQQTFYRRDFWTDQPEHVEIWLEKEALRNVFTAVTYRFQVPLYVAKGFSSVSFVYSAAEEIKAIGKPATIYLFSDHDPSGVMVARNIEKRMREFGVKAEFIRPCLTVDQIEEYNVTTRPTKESKHSMSFIGESAELDALHPAILKEIIKNCIETHVDNEEYSRLLAIERAEKETLKQITNNMMHA